MKTKMKEKKVTLTQLSRSELRDVVGGEDSPKPPVSRPEGYPTAAATDYTCPIIPRCQLFSIKWI